MVPTVVPGILRQKFSDCASKIDPYHSGGDEADSIDVSGEEEDNIGVKYLQSHL